MEFPVGDVDKAWYIASQIQQSMKTNYPLGLSEVCPWEEEETQVDRHGLDKGTVSRHFADKVVLTHHGYFNLKDLTESKALAQDDLTTETIKDIIKMVVEQGDAGKEYFSDQKIAEKIAQNHEMKIFREYVEYLRKQLNIKSSRDRQRLANNRK